MEANLKAHTKHVATEPNLILLVDDSISPGLLGRWEIARFILALIGASLDTDVHFFNQDIVYKTLRHPLHEDLDKNDIKVVPDAVEVPGGKTPTKIALERVLESQIIPLRKGEVYLKNQYVIVLTDIYLSIAHGLIQGYAAELVERKGPVAIQILYFGEDPGATRLLDELDKLGANCDMVNTIRWEKIQSNPAEGYVQEFVGGDSDTHDAQTV